MQRFLPKRFRSTGPVVPVVRLRGVIGQVSRLRPSLSITGVARSLDKAFAIKKAPAVAIVIDSPGGSAVQSRLIFKRIRDLADENDKSVLVFVEDFAASGGYMIACAGDEIYCDPSSLVGSIGVLAATFGFADAIQKIGVERRVYTAGENKMMLDPFQPEKESDIAALKEIQQNIHETFIDLVRERRDPVLGDDPDLFTGRVWDGRRALSLGLVDGLGDLRSVLRERYGEDVRMRQIVADRSLFGRPRPGLAASLGSALVESALDELEERLIRARLGAR